MIARWRKQLGKVSYSIITVIFVTIVWYILEHKSVILYIVLFHNSAPWKLKRDEGNLRKIWKNDVSSQLIFCANFWTSPDHCKTCQGHGTVRIDEFPIKRPHEEDRFDLTDKED